MLSRFKISKTLIWVTNLMLLFLLLFTVYRLATFLFFRPPGMGIDEVLGAFVLGARYDLRWIAFILMPVVAISMVPRCSPFFSAANKKWWTWYLAIVTFIVFFFFAAGFGSFSYNKTPLDAGAMNFAEDFRISWRMMRQTYPMFWLFLGLIAAVLIFRWMYHRSHWQVITRTDGLGIPYRRKFFLFAAMLLALAAWGRLSFRPLGRADSFRFGNSFKSYLAINPLQNFFGTLRLRKPNYSTQKAREVFPIMADWLQLPRPQTFSYHREIGPRSSALESRPNIVLVQCESFSMYKSSMSGNPLDPTPYFDSLCHGGIFFDRCFAPHFSTARAVFAILSGIPDAQLFKFSSRNPAAVRQHTIINGLNGYDKHYFLGGDPEFGNFEGLLKNIEGLQMHTGKRSGIPEVNVWGISDKDLLLEAHELFRRQEKPFFAYIQTAGNHRPYSRILSGTDTDFVRRSVPQDSLRRYGFESIDEFNAFRYFDHCIRRFMEAARREPYFSNTIFVFVGDHGVAGNADGLYPSVWSELRLTDEHVPLLFFAPQLLAPQQRREVVSQIDILPTIAGMLDQSYLNTTLGRDLLDPFKKHDFAFVTNTADLIGMVTNDHVYMRNINSNEEQLRYLRAGTDPHTPAQRDSLRLRLAAFTEAYFETARYLIMNNKPR